ncbi:MAG: hypothetical protein HOP18_16315, partial [Deltaproteobacteria bacterium]|nr:hypothetical protein [Deltaproteobacteria bacterium]
MRKSLIIVSLGLCTLLGIAVGVHRFTPVPPPPPPPVSSSEQPLEEPLFLDPIPPAEDVTTRGFQSGGLGLSRAAWEMLRGKPQRDGEWFLYRGKTFAVAYQQDQVWRLKCVWKQPGLALDQVRAKTRRYLPLDSRRQHTLSATADTVIEQYVSPTLAQRLTQTVASGSRPALAQPGVYTVTHTLENALVIETLV